MSLSTDALLFGITLVAFGTWIEASGLGGWPFAVSGLTLAGLAFLGSVVSTLAVADPGGPGDRHAE